jgi:hypothetical protein
MYVLIRSYSGKGTSELFDLLEQREPEAKDLITGVPGFVSYTAIRNGDGGTTITTCEDKVGTDESSKRAAEWVWNNAPEKLDPPAVTEGRTFLQF